MKTKVLKDFGVIGKHVEFTNRELEQMSQVCDKVTKVLDNHTEEKGEKKIYLDDKDLSRIEAILMCILGEERNCAETDFDKREATNMKDREHKRIVEEQEQLHGNGNDVELPTIPSLFPEQENDDMEANVV